MRQIKIKEMRLKPVKSVQKLQLIQLNSRF